MTSLVAIVMAAGHGTRMKSALPKVVHEACGRPLVYYPVKAALELGAGRVVVVVNPQTEQVVREELQRHLPDVELHFAIQQVPRGTGDAASVGMTAAGGAERVLILSGDTPLLQSSDLLPLSEKLDAGADLAFLSFLLEDPSGYGRVLRNDQGQVREIREHRDLRSDQERGVGEVNAGVYLGTSARLADALKTLSPNNAQGEYYLTDIVSTMASASDTGGAVSVIADPDALAGVNDRAQLSEAESVLHRRIRRRLAQSGVTVIGTPLIDDTVTVEPDVTIEDGVRLRGQTSIAAGARLDVGVIVDSSHVGPKSLIKAHSVLTESKVGAEVQIGPFAHLRPGSEIEDAAKLGNFVETKKAIVRRGAKVNHLSYVGDAEIGEKANLGAGTIVCNYDGFNKHRTVIGAGAFIGSDSQLIAPVNIGEGAYVATGTTVSRDVPSNGLAIGRVRQENKEGYAEKLRARLKREADAKKSST